MITSQSATAKTPKNIKNSEFVTAKRNLYHLSWWRHGDAKKLGTVAGRLRGSLLQAGSRSPKAWCRRLYFSCKTLTCSQKTPLRRRVAKSFEILWKKNISLERKTSSKTLLSPRNPFPSPPPFHRRLPRRSSHSPVSLPRRSRRGRHRAPPKSHRWGPSLDHVGPGWNGGFEGLFVAPLFAWIEKQEHLLSSHQYLMA